MKEKLIGAFAGFAFVAIIGLAVLPFVVDSEWVDKECLADEE